MQEKGAAQMTRFAKDSGFKEKLLCVRECRLRPPDQHIQVSVIHGGKYPCHLLGGRSPPPFFERPTDVCYYTAAFGANRVAIRWQCSRLFRRPGRLSI
jgi:hypothetical protein